jgi:hypothetical protein
LQPIRTFSSFSSPAKPATSGKRRSRFDPTSTRRARRRPAARDRLDDYHLPNDPLENVRIRRMLRDFVNAEIRQTDLVAVMNPLTPMSDLKLTRSKR